jgi:xylan 1,4-beta-xylosidase
MSNILQNPILPGFHPDPSALCVGQDYYIATSTFEWWPGIEIYHSRDLVNWKWVAAPISRPEQVPSGLPGNYNSGSLWAPHLSYSDGLFWLVYTDVKSSTAFKDTLNYVITAPDIIGPWSEPTFLTASGFDPSLFHDDDGKHYFLNMLFDWRLEKPGFAGTVIQEFDVATRRLTGMRRHFYNGTDLGVCEGPQILKKDGYYYLLCAAGGTGYMHAATVARARSLDGPWESSPYHPLLTSRDAPNNPLQKSGHACFLPIGDEWYITHLCARPLTERGRCTLGRETALQKIEWADGWPRLANRGKWPDLYVPAPAVSGTNVQNTNHNESVAFSPERALPHTFKTLRMPLEAEQDYSLTKRPGWLRLYGGQSLSSHHKQTLFARRWQSFYFSAETLLDFMPLNFQHTAGLILYYDTCNWIYAYVTFDEEFACRTARILICDYEDFHYGCEPVPLPDGPIYLSVDVAGGDAQFRIATAGQEPRALGGVQPASQLSDDYIETRRKRCAFTGAMVGICTQDMDAHRSFADFMYFNYLEHEDDT